MKTILVSLFLIPMVAASCASGSSISNPNSWELLGNRKVNFSADRDEIYVTAREGKFRKVKLDVERGSVNFHQCILVFGDGSRQKVAIRKTIRKGQSTRVIDLEGGARIIKKVILVYDTVNYAGKKATVKVWGRA